MRRFPRSASTVALLAIAVITSIGFGPPDFSVVRGSLRADGHESAKARDILPLSSATATQGAPNAAEAPSTLSLEAYIKASNTGTDDEFGTSVAISGDTLVVGAPNESSNATGINGNGANNGALFAGAAYVFVRSAGIWTQQAYLKASNTGAGDSFGHAVAISSDTIVIGAPYEDSFATGINGNGANNAAPDSGAAYIFVRNSGVWTQQAYVKASNTGTGDRFGYSVSVSGETVVVGADSEASSATGVNGSGADNSAQSAGAGYVFVRNAGAWAQQAYLKASNTGMGDSFGWSIAVSGDLVMVGAPYEDSGASGVNGDSSNNSVESSGASYAFVRSGVTWSQQAYLKGPNPRENAFFGYSIAASGSTAVVGSVNEDSAATGVNGNSADISATDSGAAFVFVVAGGLWTQQAYLKASNTGAGDFFGNAVAISGDTIVAGAPFEASAATGVNGNGSDNSARDAGAAYQFQRTAGAWSQAAYLKASNTDSEDQFGTSVAASSTVVIGAIGESSSAVGINGNQTDNSIVNSGAAYSFTEGGQQSLSLSVSGTSIPAGSNGTVSVVFFSRGNENIVSFSLDFDTTRLVYSSAAAGTNLPAGSSVVFNSSQVASGHLGVTLTLQPGQSLAAGPHQLLSLNLTALSNATLGATQITFGDVPIARSVTQPNGSQIPINQIVFNAGVVTIGPPLVVRSVRAVGSSIQAGASGSVSVEIDAQGSENGLAFSLTFDTAKLSYLSANLGSGAPGASLNLNTTAVASGLLGIAFDLPAGEALLPGTQSVVNVVFGVGAAVGSGTTEIAFGDSPIIRELVDTNNATLPATYLSGTVTNDAGGFEADTSPRPNGNGVVSLIDWVQTGRLAVGLDTIAPGSEYQRADCAPRETKGNGQLSLADWVQAGRYGSRLDAVVSAGGPTGPVPFSEGSSLASPKASASRSSEANESRVVALVTSAVTRTSTAQAEVRIDAVGVENAISLGLSFDPDQWAFVDARPGADALNATLVFKSSPEGSVVLALALPPGHTMVPGTRSLIDVTLKRLQKSRQRIPALRLVADAQLKAEVVDAFGNSLPGRWMVVERAAR